MVIVSAHLWNCAHLTNCWPNELVTFGGIINNLTVKHIHTESTGGVLKLLYLLDFPLVGC